MTFYTTANGKKETYKFAKGEYEEYSLICSMIWGGQPLDIEWAKNTNLYRETLKNYECRNSS